MIINTKIKAGIILANELKKNLDADKKSSKLNKSKKKYIKNTIIKNHTFPNFILCFILN